MTEIDMNYVRIGLLKWLSRGPTAEEFNKIQIPDDLQNYFTGNKEEYEKKIEYEKSKDDFKKYYTFADGKVRLTELGKKKILRSWKV
ncbi:MAG: hypothetical protein QXZ43_01840 [Candidatus Aenigmatarchaeota archaeon]